MDFIILRQSNGRYKSRALCKPMQQRKSSGGGGDSDVRGAAAATAAATSVVKTASEAAMSAKTVDYM